MTAPIKVLFINSAAFSGSTLLTRLLLSHPEIASIGELTGFVAKNDKMRKCSCGQTLTDCPFWQDLSAHLHEHGISFSPNNFGTRFRILPYNKRITNILLTGSFYSNTLEKIRDRVLALSEKYKAEITKIIKVNEIYIETISAMTGAKVILDSSKYSAHAKYLYRSDQLNIHVIHLTRDGRGVVNSYRKNSKIGIARGALRWNLSQMKSLSLKRHLPSDKYYFVRYEDICKNPLEEVNRVYEFAGLPPIDKLNPPKSKEIHIIGNRMKDEENVVIKHDESWRHELNPKHVKTIEVLSMPFLKKYNYDLIK